MELLRSSGVLLHVTSLPSGRLDADAYAWVDWLAEAGQRWWQVLPLGPPDEHGSPYKAASAFASSPELLAEPSAPVSAREERAFRERHAFWVDTWAEFAGEGAVADQVRFEREWRGLRDHAASRGVQIMGDVPIYVAPGSAEHVQHPELFRSGVVAGAPPDKFAEQGQLWGNPLYDWGCLRRTGFRWWTERFRRTFELFEVARIDHFRGFVAYWAVPEDAEDARVGGWRRGPGREVFDAASRELGELPLIAEDLGIITPAVERLRDELELPGMVVLQFGFDPDDPRGPHRLERHAVERVVYTGTHDHDTIRGWYDALEPDARSAVERELDRAGLAGDDVWWGLIRLAFSSRSRVALVQAQDILGLGSEARMNVPGTKGASWRWKLEPGQLTSEHARRLRAATEESGRIVR